MIRVIVEMRAFQWDPCRACGGTGKKISVGTTTEAPLVRVDCPSCKGQGRIAHDPPRERLVEIPYDEWNASLTMEQRLSLVFHFGQNDFQPRAGCYSMSSGDVARLPDGRRFLCEPIGWTQL